jgi:hypothetical protein
MFQCTAPLAVHFLCSVLCALYAREDRPDRPHRLPGCPHRADYSGNLPSAHRGVTLAQSTMEFSKTHIAIAAGAGVLLLFVFFGYLVWLNGQGPVLSRSEDHDPLSGVPNSISLNPLRDRSSERVAAKFLRSMRDGECKDELSDWEKDYRKKYAAFICDSESRHPLVSWEVADWDDAPPLRILQYRGKRRNRNGGSGTYKELFSVTLERKSGDWEVTKYDAIY